MERGKDTVNFALLRKSIGLFQQPDIDFNHWSSGTYMTSFAITLATAEQRRAVCYAWWVGGTFITSVEVSADIAGVEGTLETGVEALCSVP